MARRPDPSVPVLVATDEKAFDDELNAALAKDTYGTQELFANGRIFSAPRNSKVLVIEIGFAKTKVRILDGDSAGKAGWVPYEWVKDSPAP